MFDPDTDSRTARPEHQQTPERAVQHRFRPDSQLLRTFVAKGDLGEIFFAKAGWLRRRDDWDSDEVNDAIVRFVTHGSMTQLLDEVGLSANELTARVRAWVKGRA